MTKTWGRSQAALGIGRRLARRLVGEDGLALPLALGVLSSLSIATTSIVYASTQNSRDAGRFAADQVGYAAAEGGLSYALRDLYAAPDPLLRTLFVPERKVTAGAATVVYSGVLDEAANVWTLTATSSVRGPSGRPVSRTLRRTVEVIGVNPNATISAWNRIYHDDASRCLAFENVAVPSAIATRGDVCLLGTARATASVDAGGGIQLDKHASIGSASAPVDRVGVGRACSWNRRPAHQPCGPADQVYARTTSAPQNLAKPAVDFEHWYAHAAPGPLHPCTTSTGTPPRFDDNGVFDRSVPFQELAPSAASYTCEVRGEDGALLGALSWNHATHVLEVKGTIFVDGDVGMLVGGQIVNYHGQATLYASGTYELRGGAVCAGGAGNTNCRNSGVGTWDPAQNLLVLVVGAKTGAGYDVQIHQTSGAFQGAVHAAHDCRIGDTSYMSGPLICNGVIVDKTASLFTWPVLPELLTGQLYGSPLTSPYRKLVLGPQFG